MKSRTITTDELDRRYAALSDAVVDALESVDTGRTIFEIGKKHGLAIDTIGDVATTVGYVMLGVISSDEFVAAINDVVGDKTKSNAVAMEINQRIFLPIRQWLKKTTLEKTPAATTLPATVPPQTNKAPLPATPVAPTSTLTPKRETAPPALPPQPPEPMIIRPTPNLGFEDQGLEAKEVVSQQRIAERGAVTPKPEIPEVRVPPIIRPMGTLGVREPEPIESLLVEPPVERPLPAPRSTPSPLSPHVITKDELRRPGPPPPPPSQPPPQPPAPALPPAAPQARLLPSPSQPLRPQPAGGLKLPADKIPRPPAPEQYGADPYREVVE